MYIILPNIYYHSMSTSQSTTTTKSSGKKSKTTQPVVDTVAPVSVPVTIESVSVPVELKKRSTKAKQSVVSVPVEVVSAPVEVVSAPVVSVPVDVVTMDTEVVDGTTVSLTDMLADELKKQNELLVVQASSNLALRQCTKNITKLNARILKSAEKKKSKRKVSSNESSGFTMPCSITDELATFIGIPPGTEIARNKVSLAIHNYILANNLQNPENRRTIFADAKLSDLLKRTTDECTKPLSYFNLQKYMTKHYVSGVKTA
jgi:upstream activation factor subunit UAF30